MNEKISKYKINNEIDIERIINEYSNYLFKVVENICGNYLTNEDIEEVLTDVFLAIWKNKEKLDGEKLIKPYISSIAHNLTKKKMNELYKNKNDEPLDESIMIDTNDFDFMMETNFKKQDLDYIINSLPKEDYQIFTLFYYYSNKTKQIANKLGISNVKVKTKLHRIRKHIRSKLKERGYSV